MASNAEFSLNNLNTNPSFNFSNALYNSDFFRNTNGDENVDDSPYSNIDVHCNYFDENQFVNKYRNITNFSCLCGAAVYRTTKLRRGMETSKAFKLQEY